MAKRKILVKDTASAGKDKTQEFCNLLTDALRNKRLEEDVQVVRAADLGVYNQGAALRFLPEDFLYVNVTDKDITAVVEQTVAAGKKIEKLLSSASSKQMRIVLRNCGVIDPESIDDYIAHDGYEALAKVLGEYTPEKVIEEMKASGLRGRGGAGFPTGLKWELTRKVPGAEKFVVCNGDEGDPGAYMDRSVLEGDPHSVVEGMIIEAYAIGATKGYFYIRAEYPLAVERIEKAIKDCYTYGLLGKNILGSNFSFDVEIRLGAGAFVCGEETALIASIEGRRGYPRPRPPYPAVKGLWDKPTVINNVETMANIPIILLKGSKWFAGIGTQGSKGTKVFALTGKIKNSGLIEVPMGTSIRDVVFNVGGGILNNKKIKAIQTGGPSGGVIPEKFFDTPLDYESLGKLGSIMGSGGMIVMDETDCMVDISKFYLQFCIDESCGKCAPCRIGGKQLLNYLTKISEGKGTLEDLDRLKRIASAMKKASLCGLGQTAPNPVLSTLNYFDAEYKEHVEAKKCSSGKCEALFNYTISPEKCKRCGLCVRHCPVDAISGDREKGYTIDTAKCIKCGQCFEVCKFNAVIRG